MQPNTPLDESNVLEKVETALKEAVHQHPTLSWEYGTRIKRQKYVYLAINHFTPSEEELPVTYSWYKFGAVLPAAPQTGTIGPTATQMPTPSARSSGIYTVPLHEIVSFFKSDQLEPNLTEEYWYASDLDFLADFYDQHAPPEYRDLYMGNIEFRQRLSEAIKRVGSCFEKRNQSTDTCLSEDDYESLGRAAARMHLGIVGTEYLDETLSSVRRFTNLVEDAFLVLSRTEASETTDSQLGALNELTETYNEWVWEYPALLISKQTATGPNASTLRKWSAQKHISVENNLDQKINDAERVCRRAKLVPSSSEYPQHNDKLGQAVQKIALGATRRGD